MGKNTQRNKSYLAQGFLDVIKLHRELIKRNVVYSAWQVNYSQLNAFKRSLPKCFQYYYYTGMTMAKRYIAKGAYNV